MKCNDYPKNDIHGHLIEECPELVKLKKERDDLYNYSTMMFEKLDNLLKELEEPK